MMVKKLFGLALALGIALSSPDARADDPPATYADAWLDARDGDETTPQWISRQLTTDLASRIVTPGANGTKGEIARLVIAEIKGLRASNGQRRIFGPCVEAAVEQTHNLTLAMERRDVMNGAVGMFFGALGGAAGGAGTARDLTGYFGRELAEKILGAVRSKSVDRANRDVQEFLRNKGIVTDRADDARGKCRSEYRMAWNLAQQTYEYVIVGDCYCERQGNGVRLSRWSMRGSGTVVPSLHYNEQRGLFIQFAVSRPSVALTASCCDANGNRSFTRHPNEGEGGCDYVGVTFRNETVVQPGRPNIIPRTRGDSGQPATAPAQGSLLTMPDDKFEELYEKATNDDEQAGFAVGRAMTRLQETTRRSGGEETDEVRKAQEELEAAQQAKERAAARVRQMMDAAGQRTDRETNPQQQQQQEQVPDNQARREARGTAIDQVMGLPPPSSGTEVPVAWSRGRRDPAADARRDAERAALDAQDHEASDAQTGPAADNEGPLTPAIVQPSPLAAPAADGIAGTWKLADTSPGVEQITIRKTANGHVLSGLGPDILLEAAGNAWFGEGAVLFNKGGHEIRLVAQGGGLILTAYDQTGGSFQTSLRR